MKLPWFVETMIRIWAGERHRTRKEAIARWERRAVTFRERGLYNLAKIADGVAAGLKRGEE